MVAAKLSRPFRIIALPLVRIPHGPLRARAAAAAGAGAPAPGATAVGAAGVAKTTSASGAATTSDAETPLVLYHVQQPDVKPTAGPPPIVNKALDKASEAWLKLGDKKEGSVMRWFYDKGESLMDRMEFEEWALKNVHEGKGVKIADPKKGETQEKITIPLLRPASIAPPLVPKLHRQLLHRIPYHKKMMYRCLFLSPITWPFAIIPVIPNFPLFYVLWRAWSHYKAWRGATYLEQLLKLGMIVDTPSPELEKIYERRQITSTEALTSNSSNNSSSTTSSSDADSDAPALLASDQEPAPSTKPELPHYNQLLLSKDDIEPALEEAFNLRQAEVIDIERAIVQADHRASEAEKTLRLQAEGAAKAASSPNCNGNGNGAEKK